MVLTRSQSNASPSTGSIAPAKRKKSARKVGGGRQQQHPDITSSQDAPASGMATPTFKIPRIEPTDDLVEAKIPPPPPAPTPAFAEADQLAKTPNGRNTLGYSAEPNFSSAFCPTGVEAGATVHENKSDRDLSTAVIDVALESLKEPEPGPEERPLPEVATVLSESLPLQSSLADPNLFHTAIFSADAVPRAPAVTLPTTGPGPVLYATTVEPASSTHATVEPPVALTASAMTDNLTTLPVVPAAPAASTIPAPAPAPVSAELTLPASPPVILATAEDSSLHSLEGEESSVSSLSTTDANGLTQGAHPPPPTTMVNIATHAPLLLAE